MSRQTWNWPSRVPHEMALYYMALPLAREDGEVSVAIAHPENAAAAQRSSASARRPNRTGARLICSHPFSLAGHASHGCALDSRHPVLERPAQSGSPQQPGPNNSAACWTLRSQLVTSRAPSLEVFFASVINS